MSETNRKPDLTVMDVAAELSVTREHVLGLLKTRQLVGYRISKKPGAGWRVTPESMDAFKRACEGTTA